MQKDFIGKTRRLLFVIFILLTAAFFLAWILLPDTGVDWRVLIIGNLILYLIGLISASMSSRALLHKSVQGFLRLVYGSFLLKFFALAISAFIYILVFKKQINKPALFGCFGLYFIYTFIEMRSVMKQSKKPDA